MKTLVGIVADDMNTLHRLRNILITINCDVKYSFTLAQLQDMSPVEPDLWLVVSEEAADIFDVLSEWGDVQIFLADEMPSVIDEFAYKQWRQRLEEKLNKVITPSMGEVDSSEPPILAEDEKFKDVWVLAASLGGPEAVKVFLSHVDKNLPIAFIYAQHIEESFSQILPDVLNKESPFEVFFGENHSLIKRGTVTVFPSHQLTKIDPQCVLHVAESIPWKAPYTPNIDQIIYNVAESFRENMGVIIFSGMCDDSAEAALALSKKGVTIWAQEPSECICDSMPDAVISTDCVDYVGTAKLLAERLNQHYSEV